MPWPGDAGVNRRETVQRHQYRRHTIAQASVDRLADAAVIRLEDRLAAGLGGLAREAFVTGYGGRFAQPRNGACRLRRAIAVDHQPRVALRDQMGVEMFR